MEIYISQLFFIFGGNYISQLINKYERKKKKKPKWRVYLSFIYLFIFEAKLKTKLNSLFKFNI